jgi:hypothetical protein
MVPIALEILKFYNDEQTSKECFDNSVKSLADIVRTPVYGVVLTVISLAGVIAIPFSPNLAYDVREVYGNVEQSLNWGIRRTETTLARCFQPICNIDGSKEQYLFENTNKNLEDKEYSEEDIKHIKIKNLEDRLNKFAERVIEHRRKYYNIFDQIIGTLDSNIAYKSYNIERINKLKNKQAIIK